MNDDLFIRKLIGSQEPVPSVPKSKGTATALPEQELGTGVLSVQAAETGRMPYLLSDGTLVIPFGSPERFHWWRGGQSVAVTTKEWLRASEH
jgi:hypothetical protein